MATSSIDRPNLTVEPSPPVRPLLLWGMRLAALIAIAVSGYITSVVLAGSGSVGCSGGFDCDEVLQSRWSTWFGLPVSLPGMSLYLSLLCALAFSGPLTPPNVRRTAWTIALALSLIAGAAALWFFALQTFVLGAFCSWCLTVHLCGLGLATLALLAGNLSALRLGKLSAAAVGGLAILVVGQFVAAKAPPSKQQRVDAARPASAARHNQPQKVTTQRITTDDLYSPNLYGHDDLTVPTNNPPTIAEPADEVASLPGETETAATSPSPDDLEAPSNALPSAITDAPVPRATTTPSAAETRSRIVSLFRGDAQIDVYQHPVLGSPAAPYVIVKLFDYTCPHCREMHEHLQQAREEFGGKLAVVMCPVPLNRQCNPHVTYDSAKHADACDLARLALAVWQADRSKFAEFDAWIFASPVPPTAAAAREQAIGLVGEDQLVAQLYSGKLRERLAIGPKLYKLFGAGTVPKLVLPTGLLVGPGDSTEAVVLELKKEFASPLETP